MWADDLDVGKILIAALTNFIIPLIEGNTMAPGERIDIPPTNISKSQYFSVGIGPDTSYTLSHPITEDQQRSVDSTVLPGARLTIEGQGLLIALAQFAASIMDSSNSDQVERQSPENLDQFRGVASRCASPVASDSDEFDYSDVLGLECSTHVPQLEERDEYMWEISEHYLIDAGGSCLMCIAYCIWLISNDRCSCGQKKTATVQESHGRSTRHGFQQNAHSNAHV